VANEVLIEKRNKIAYVTINRPEKRNAANSAVQKGLGEAWNEINRDKDVWICILTGAGTDSFCAGGDLGENLARSTGELAVEDDRPSPVGERPGPPGYGGIWDVFKPVIAAVNGYAAGGGFGLALSCDMRLCSENAQFGASEVRWSHMAGGQAYILPRTVPLGWAFWFTLTGQFIDAETAFRIGIVQGVYPQDQLMEQATKLADTINANGTIVTQQTKQFIYNSMDMPLSQARKMERLYYQRIRQSPDYDEGSAAFVQKRRPKFSGKPTGASPKG
jgi:E-phenylitaconyl-CoA hydratase